MGNYKCCIGTSNLFISKASKNYKNKEFFFGVLENKIIN